MSKFLKQAQSADENSNKLVVGFIRQLNRSDYITPGLINYTVLYYYFLWNLMITVKAQDGTEVYFKIKLNTKLSKLMDAYCARIGYSKLMLMFLFDGDRITGDETPQQLKMEDEDAIDVMAMGS